MEPCPKETIAQMKARVYKNTNNKQTTKSFLYSKAVKKIIRVTSNTACAGAAAVVIAIVLSWIFKQTLSLGSDASGGDFFGWSVALDGNRALVGAPYRDGFRGTAYIFDLSGGNWNERADISLGSDASGGDYFGWSVALDGNRALVGAPYRDGFRGAAYIFDLSGGNWTETADISLGTFGVSGDIFGYSVALDGSRALVGAPYRDGFRGAAYIFDLSGGNWNERADISLGSDASGNDQFGWSVALDGNRALVGAPYRNGQKGAAYIFDLSGGNWTETADISLGTVGVSGDRFGYSVALDGSRALVGAVMRDGETGAAYIFDLSGGNWTEPAVISLGTVSVSSEFIGYSVALDGNRALVGAYDRDVGKGAAYIFDLSGGNWTETADISLGGGVDYDGFGFSVALDGSRALVAAPGRNGGKGAAYIYEKNN